MKKLSFYCITLFLLIACASKNNIHYTHIIVDDFPRTKSNSIVRFIENITIVDTTVATVSGKIYGEFYSESEPFQPEDILPFTNIALTNIETQEIIGTTTDLDGNYNLSVPAAAYQLEISFITFNIVVIENIQLGTGEIFNLSAQLGLGIDKEYFEIRNHRTKKELIRKTN